MRVKKAFYPWLVASIVCMAAIFISSAQSADVSSELSGAMTRGLFSSIGARFGIVESAWLLDRLEYFLRKTAHLMIFAVLGFCVFNAVRQLSVNDRKAFLLSLCGCSFYAATDEFHQYFVPGRACMWQDWLIDTAGVLLGCAVALLFALRYRKKRGKQQGQT